MKFDWEEFMNKDNNIAVHCKTEEEAIDFCKKMDKLGMRWHSGRKYTEDNDWYVHRDKMCYYNDGEYSSLNYAEENNEYKILEWSNYMGKEPIDYLKYGYVVEFENGALTMYMPSQEEDCFVHYPGNSCIYLSDLKGKDIVKIYGYSKYGYMSTEISIKDRPLIWERLEEVKKMTVSEICKELGYKVEIIAEEK